jgi:formyltetrahydrofolate deformylase
MSDSVSAVLLVSCPDQKGLVAAISDFVFRHDGNIVDFDQHSDLDSNLFLARLSWKLGGFKLSREAIADAFRPIAERFSMWFEVRFSDETPRVAIFVSKLDHCLQDLLWRWKSGELRAEIPMVVSNHADLRGLAGTFGVNYFVHAITPDTKRREEDAILARLRAERIELIVLARYMQVLSDAFVKAYPNRVINIHHSFLPAFAGAKPYHQAHERGVKLIGATGHYVTSDLDEGPIIEQGVTQVSHRDSVADLIRKGRDLEKVVLARAVMLHLQHRVLPYGNKTVVFE